jgi:hypothetical protein
MLNYAQKQGQTSRRSGTKTHRVDVRCGCRMFFSTTHPRSGRRSAL